MMNKLLGWMRLRPVWIALLAMGLLAPVAAFADSYRIVLKVGGTPVATSCAVGSFTFTKTAAGAFTPANPQVTVVSNNCFASMGSGNYNSPTNFQVHVANVADQGLNVVGISGELRTTGGNQTRRFEFAYSGTPTTTPTGAATYFLTNGDSTTGTYFVVNDKNLLVPEPSALWLVFAALGALFAVRRARVGGT